MSKFWKKIFTSKYSGKQIDEAVGKVLDGDVGMSNPMTAAGDIIIGGTDGEPEKLAKGTDGKVLKMVSGAPAWADDAGGMANPMTTAGDMIAGSIEGAPYRIPKGTQGQVLTMGASFPEWAAAQGGGHLYWHAVDVRTTDNFLRYACFIIINASAADITVDDLKSIITNGGALNVTQGWGKSDLTSSEIVPYLVTAAATQPETQCNVFGIGANNTPVNNNIAWTAFSVAADYKTQLM